MWYQKLRMNACSLRQIARQHLPHFSCLVISVPCNWLNCFRRQRLIMSKSNMLDAYEDASVTVYFCECNVSWKTRLKSKKKIEIT